MSKFLLVRNVFTFLMVFILSSCRKNDGSAPSSTPTYQPSITVTATPSSIDYGGFSTITWTSVGVSSVISSGGGGTGPTGSFITNSLQTNTTFTVTSGDGKTKAFTTVTVGAPLATVTLTAKSPSIAYGDSTTITWKASNATSVTIVGKGTVDSAGTFGTSALFVATTYTVVATNKDGKTTTATVTVTVGDDPKIAFLTAVKGWKKYRLQSKDLGDWSDYILNECEKDDLHYFYSNGRFMVDQGADKCNPQSPAQAVGAWSFNADHTKLTWGGETWDIKTLTADTLRLYEVVPLIGGGSQTTAEVMSTYIHP